MLEAMPTCSAVWTSGSSACSFKKVGQKKTPGKAGQRYWKNVGLGFKTPKEAIEGEQLKPLQGGTACRRLEEARGRSGLRPA